MFLVHSKSKVVISIPSEGTVDITDFKINFYTINLVGSPTCTLLFKLLSLSWMNFNIQSIMGLHRIRAATYFLIEDQQQKQEMTKS